MKKALFFTTIIGGSFLCSPVFSQEKEIPDSLGLPGDNLNLYGVLDLFQKSETLEEFEKKLNSEDAKVNNLDLNNNDKIDYISVIDNVKGTAHTIVLQVAVSEKETQDVAVILVEKDKDDKVQLQVVGDELLYGKNYIIEPKSESLKSTKGETPNPGYTGAEKSNNVTNTTNNYYNSNTNVNSGYAYPVSSWGIVRYMYYPTYTVYVSPWRWGYYPGYWNPWAPMYWHSYYYGYHYPHYSHYHGYYYRSYDYHNPTSHNYYYGQRRKTSTIVNQRRDQGDYRKTYSRPDLAPKQVNNRARTRENKVSDRNVGKTTPERTAPVKERAAPQNRAVDKSSAPERNNNVNRPGKSNKPSPSVKPTKTARPKVSPAPRTTPQPQPVSRPVNKGKRGGDGPRKK